MNNSTIDYYEQFGGVYDAIVGDRKDAAKCVRQLLKQYAPKAKTLLEVACGTGSMLAQLQRSYTVSGLDLSQTMLFQAQEKVANCPLYQGDMRDFSIEEQFDVVICVFDSINHLQKKSDWQKAFNCIAQHLKPGGIFIFDVNTLYKLNRLADEPAIVHDFEGKTFILKVEKKSPSKFFWNMRLFYPVSKDYYTCLEESIPETAYDLSDIKTMAAKKFVVKAIRTAEGGRVSKKTDRAYFVCIKTG